MPTEGLSGYCLGSRNTIFQLAVAESILPLLQDIVLFESLEPQQLAELAAHVTLRSLEPGAPTGDGIRTARHVRIAARANFAAFFAFLQGLPTLPSLVVPVAMHVGRAEQGLAIEATLQVFDALPAAPHPVEC